MVLFALPLVYPPFSQRGLPGKEKTVKDTIMLTLILPMFPFILPLLLGVILVCGLWIHDVSYLHQKLSPVKVTQPRA